MTQRGARTDFQHKLRARGVEVVEFDFLTPHAVAAYCYDRGFLQCLWECGGTLSAPAIAAGVIHKTLAFIAPKLVSIYTLTTLYLALEHTKCSACLDMFGHSCSTSLHTDLKLWDICTVGLDSMSDTHGVKQ